MTPEPLHGRQIGVYRIGARLGAGAMGEVYQARDTRLGRDVAIKVLPAAFLNSADRLARFKREARLLAALNHPNVATIHGLEEDAGQYYLVMELVGGETLADRIARGPLALRDALDIAGQMADALAAAHDKGVVHRDLKPANVKVTPEGRVKILDLGLARTLADADDDLSTAPMLSQQGQILGTPAYMSPEQARGEPLDPRSDVFSFGVVLYEMVTGRLPFRGASLVETLSAILTGTATPPARLNPEVPPKLDEIVLKALEKDRTLRYQSAADLRADLQRLKRDLEPTAAAAPLDARRSSLGYSTRWRRAWPVAATVVLGGAGLMTVTRGVWHHPDAAHTLTARDTVVLADFTNHTGDPVFDDALRQGLSVDLEQSPFLSVIPDEQIQQTLRMMGQKPDARLSGPLADEACQRTASAAVLEGSIAQIGTEYNLILKATDCSSGASLASTEAQAADKSHVLEALDRAASDMRRRLGESLTTVRRFDTPLERATTPSLEALKAFSSGYRTLFGPDGSPAAIPFFRHATELDPNFALAYAMLGRMFIDVGESGQAMEATRKAYELRDRGSEAERYIITASYDLLVTGDLHKAQDTCRLWIGDYPRAVEPRNFLAGPVDLQLGQYQDAITQASEAVRAHPDLPIAYAHLVFSDLALNRPQDAEAAYRQALARHVDSPFLALAAYELDFVNGDTAGLAKLVADTAGKPGLGLEGVMLANEALTAAYAGQLAKARQFSRQAAASAERAGHSEERASYLASAALAEALFGNVTEARQQAGTTLDLSNARDNQYAAALALSLSGDGTRGQQVVDDLARRFPEDTVARFNYLPALRAQLALNRADARRALDELQAASPYETGQPGQELFEFLAGYPVYLRGEAYLTARQGGEAAGEFQRILDLPGVVANEPIGALARLGLARALRLQGRAAEARVAYQDLLQLWKDADPDLPVVRTARSEYAALTSGGGLTRP
jgi:eukaryotic-like serine/threonine-protein kinase